MAERAWDWKVIAEASPSTPVDTTKPSIARVYDVDNDPIVLAHGRALLVENDKAAVVTADLRQPADVLARPEIEALIDFDEPVGLVLVGVIHHLGDDEGPRQVVQAYLDAVPSGSYLFLTHFCASSPDAPALPGGDAAGPGHKSLPYARRDLRLLRRTRAPRPRCRLPARMAS